MNSSMKLRKWLALPLLFVFLFTLACCALTGPAHAGTVAGVSTHLFLTVTGDADSDATFLVTWTDALGTHTQTYYPGMEVTAWSPVTITVVDHTAEKWSIDADVQEATISGVGGVTYPTGTNITVTGTNTIQAFATNFGLHYINIHVVLHENDINGGGSGDNGGGSGDNGGGSGDNGGGSGDNGGGSGDNGGGSGDNGGGSGDNGGGSGDNGGGSGDNGGGSGDNGGGSGDNGGGSGDNGGGSGDNGGGSGDNGGGSGDNGGGSGDNGGDPGDNGGDPGDNGGNGSSPKTGDARAIGLLVVLALASGAVFAVTYVKKKQSH